MFSKLAVVALACVCLVSNTSAWKTVSSREWEELDRKIDGDVILPTDDDYSSQYQLWSSTYDDVYPMAIVKCTSAEDVRAAYNLILDHFESEVDVDKQILSLRCGKHSFIGASTTSGIVIDVSGLQTLDITEDGTALVAPGINLSTFTAWAEEHDVTLPHGDCASVTFGGFLQGGGIGLTSRTFGMGADWVQSFDIILANGDFVRAAKDNEYSDLFWATLGGGGGNFGIITQYEMNVPTKTQENPGLYLELTWDLTYENWQAVSAGWKQFMNNDDYQDHWATYLRIQPTNPLTNEYYVALHGFWTGEQTAGLLVLAELLTEIDITPATATINLNVHFEGWIESSSSTRVRYSTQCKSRWAMEELESEFFDLLYTQVDDLRTYEPLDSKMSEDDDDLYVYPTQFFFIAPADGAIATSGTEDDISFPFRDARYFFAMCGRWRDGYKNAEEKMGSWLANTMDVIQPHLSQYSFVSFPDWDLENWQESYFRDNYEKLQEIKDKYDPDYIFRYSQSIVPKNWIDRYGYENNELYKLSYQRSDYKLSRSSAAAKAAGIESEGNNPINNNNNQELIASTSTIIKHNNLIEFLSIISVVILLFGYAGYHFIYKRNKDDDYKVLNDNHSSRSTLVAL